jgi:hypothetical protein
VHPDGDLGSSPTRVTHLSRAKGPRVRSAMFGSVRHPTVSLWPAAACRARGTLASVRICVASRKQGFQHGVSQRPASGRTPMGENSRASRQPDGRKARPRASASGSIFMVETGEDHGIHGDRNNDAARRRTARSAQILFCSVDSVILARFSVLKPLLSVLRMPRAKKCACCGARTEDDAGEQNPPPGALILMRMWLVRASRYRTVLDQVARTGPAPAKAGAVPGRRGTKP